jgi:hypothetical protein
MSNYVFHFDGYGVRRIEEGDRVYLDQLIAADAFHRDCMSADYFLDLVPGEDSWAIEDDKGEVVLYFKTQTAVRLFLQFAKQDNLVNRTVLTKGLGWLEFELVKNHFREILFDSHNPVLRIMAQKRLGFRESNQELVRSLPAPMGVRGVDGLWHHRPQPCEREG